MTGSDAKNRLLDKLLDAVELVKLNQHDKANELLREIIREDSDFEYAWLWMSVTVESLDQSSVCLDNVLRVNPTNHYAAGALSRIREPERNMQRRRGRVQFYRDVAFFLMWGFIIVLLYVMLVTIVGAPPV